MFKTLIILATAATMTTGNTIIDLPNGRPGVGFDDLSYSPALKRIIVPAGRSGNIDLIDPETRGITMIPGFSSSSTYGKGHDFGVTSADAGDGGLLYATDRTTSELAVVDVSARKIVARVKLAASPDYVRYVSATNEAWVSEPDSDQIEIFSLGSDKASPKASATIHVTGGPESLVIDSGRKRAYTNLWKGSTLAIDLQSREIVARWPNHCDGSRGLAIDRDHGVLFVGCSEGKAVALHDGVIVAEEKTGDGVDIIDYNAGRLFVPAGKAGNLTIFGTDAEGKLTRRDTVDTVAGAHCVAADARGRGFVCDPGHGRLLVVGGR
jgi:DNA-binding beta-propeller fold protein YncE